MKNLKSILFISALGVAATFSACDNMEDDVPPANSSSIIVNHDYYTTFKNQGLVFNVLTNDSIGSNAAITFNLPANGTVQAGNTPGTASYQPKNNFVGIDSFSYQACIGGACASAKVFVEVKDSVCTIRAFDDYENLNNRSFDTTSVLKNDLLCGFTPGNTIITISKQPMHGLARVHPNKQIEYLVNPNYVGQDELTYTISNAGGQATAKIRYNITNTNCNVNAVNDIATLVHANQIDSVSVNVLQNDTWCNPGTPAPVISFPYGQQTNYGNFGVYGTGTNARVIYFTNSPARNVYDTFTYRICQGNNCDNATITVHIQ